MNRRTVTTLAVAGVLLLLMAGTALVGGRVLSGPAPVRPVKPPSLVVDAQAVWYDAAGLHRGDVVEKTPVDLFAGWPRNHSIYNAKLGPVLALVRGGAVYRDWATDDVWFHPWGGQPRVVGQGSATGPGGDAEGDVAAWFEGGELVVYDTTRGSELSRTSVTPGTPEDTDPVPEHIEGANPFIHVSATEVVWRAAVDEDQVHRLDVSTGTASTVWVAPADTVDIPDPFPVDVHDSTWAWGRLPGGLLVQQPGQDQRHDALEPVGRLSADGSYLLSTTDPTQSPHAAAIVDVRTGKAWTIPGSQSYPYIAWSYGDLALVRLARKGQDDSLMACNAATRACDQLPLHGRVLLPTS